MDTTTSKNLLERAHRYLHHLCIAIPDRSVGSPGNRAATDFFAGRMAACGFQTARHEFTCTDWESKGARLAVNGVPYEAFPSPYSLGGTFAAPLSAVSTVEELEASSPRDQVLLLRGELAREQLMPKHFPFYNPEEHQRIVALLEEKRPAALICATGRNPELAGAVYPFPLIEDGDFDIPSVFMTEEEGARLATQLGQSVSLEILARRIPSNGYNIVASSGNSERRVVFTAHIDSKKGTPGALDNASGVVVLLLLADLLRDYAGDLGVEIVPFNGEDYYAVPGQLQYLRQVEGRLDRILLNVNLDAPGFVQGETAYSLYNCPEPVAAAVKKAFAAYPGLKEGQPWYQGDHMVFVQSQVPALAITSSAFAEILTSIAHTEKDQPSLVEPAKLVEIALALQELVISGKESLTK